MKNYHGIILQLHFIAQKQAELQNELHVEQKKRHQPYYCNLDRMISGGWILCNAIAVCEMTKTSWQTGTLKMNEDLGESFWDMLCSRGEFCGENILTAEIEEQEKLDASEKNPRRLNAKEVLITQIYEEFVFLVADGSAKFSGRDCEFQEETKKDEGIQEDSWAHPGVRKEFHLSSYIEPRSSTSVPMSQDLH